jgi:hypothetical protein
MPSFNEKKTTTPTNPFSEFCDPTIDDGISTKVFGSPDARFDSPRKIGKRKIQCTCPECGHMFEQEVATYDMKTGQKTFLKEMG